MTLANMGHTGVSSLAVRCGYAAPDEGAYEKEGRLPTNRL